MERAKGKGAHLYRCAHNTWASMEKKILETPRLIISSIDRSDLEFLQGIWNDPEIMCYAGSARNWGEEEMEAWYTRYLARLAKDSTTEIQFVCRLKEGECIGESGLGRLRRGWRCSNYSPPAGRLTVMADVKLLKKFRNVEYGTEAMKAIAGYVFIETPSNVLLVPPHRDNPPAIRMYEKVGFKRTAGIYYKHHLIYEMTDERFAHICTIDPARE